VPRSIKDQVRSILAEEDQARTKQFVEDMWQSLE
jgi:hypothetical protein